MVQLAKCIRVHIQDDSELVVAWLKFMLRHKVYPVRGSSLMGGNSSSIDYIPPRTGRQNI